jgi:hypothetical protein
MLSKLYDTLRHQSPDTFDHVYTSDPRFYDRYWFGIFDQTGEIAMLAGMGLYANTNVLDGFTIIMRNAKQYNLRASRQLRPALDDTSVGPLQIDVVEPLQTLRLRMQPGDHRFSYDLVWDGFLSPHEEEHHFARSNGRVTQDYTRFDQVGTLSGWLDLDGTRYEPESWFGARDHSWGVRPGMGAMEPANGAADTPALENGFLFLWLNTLAADTVVYFQSVEDGSGNRLSLEGWIRRPGVDKRVVGLEHEIEFFDGTRSARKAHVVLTATDGETLTIDAEPLTAAPFAFVGSGYDNGFIDGLGLGAYRGELLVEHDIYDVSHPADVVLPDGSTIRPGHREAPFRVWVNGVETAGHFPIMSAGPIPRYGLG